MHLLTIGVGPLLYERYGHVAVCVVDDAQPDDTRCYNYGMTDFEAPPEELGWQQLRGTARFWVTEESFAAMVQGYVDRDRSQSIPAG